VEQNHNEVISYLLAAVVLFYGVMAGLIAVGIWEQFSSADEKVAEEAAALASVYRDTGAGVSQTWAPRLVPARHQT